MASSPVFWALDTLSVMDAAAPTGAIQTSDPEMYPPIASPLTESNRVQVRPPPDTVCDPNCAA
jgi:hypothetical protein